MNTYIVFILFLIIICMLTTYIIATDIIATDIIATDISCSKTHEPNYKFNSLYLENHSKQLDSSNCTRFLNFVLSRCTNVFIDDQYLNDFIIVALSLLIDVHEFTYQFKHNNIIFNVFVYGDTKYGNDIVVVVNSNHETNTNLIKESILQFYTFLWNKNIKFIDTMIVTTLNNYEVGKLIRSNIDTNTSIHLNMYTDKSNEYILDCKVVNMDVREFITIK